MTHRIDRRPAPRKPWLTDYRCDGGPWFRAANLYDAARKLQAQGIAGEATAYAANGTPSFEGSIERWAGLMVVEPDRGTVRVVPYRASSLWGDAQDASEASRGAGVAAEDENAPTRPTDAPEGT